MAATDMARLPTSSTEVRYPFGQVTSLTTGDLATASSRAVAAEGAMPSNPAWATGASPAPAR